MEGFGCGDDHGVIDDSVIDDLLNVNDGSVFYENFHLPEFPCMSPYSPTSSSASLVGASASTASWAMLNRDDAAIAEMENRVVLHVGSGGGNGPSETLASTASMEMIHEKSYEEDAAVTATSGTSSTAAPTAMSEVDQCMDVMGDFGYMELLEGDDVFDPTSIFQSDNLLDKEDQTYVHEKENEGILVADTRCDGVPGVGVEVEDDMGAVLLEWLRANRDNISMEDLRKVKIKKSTIETAARRLGGGKEAMKHLLKLILEWVQTNHLPRKYTIDSSLTYRDFYQQVIQSNPNPDFTPAQPASAMFADPNTSDSWCAPSPPLFPQPGMDPSLTAQMDFQMVDSSQSWPTAIQWPSYDYMENFQPVLGSPPGFSGGLGYPRQYPLQYFGAGSSHTKCTRMGSSATKEARKKRMAQQRQSLSHHHHHRVIKSHPQGAIQHNVAVNQTPGLMGSENLCADTGQLDGHVNWMSWSPTMQGGVMASGEQLQVQPTEVLHPVPPPSPQSFPRPIPSQQTDRRQGWKPESSLKFLLQKVLKQSDVGNLGRIVLPKKEAETQLPELDARDGISIAMEDIGTSRVWNMRYRFWPNNKSRMYLLENTGDFVKANRLEEGDFIVIYSDTKCGKYLIRGVKVREPVGATKAESKRPSKAQIRSNNDDGDAAGSG